MVGRPKGISLRRSDRPGRELEGRRPATQRKARGLAACDGCETRFYHLIRRRADNAETAENRKRENHAVLHSGRSGLFPLNTTMAGNLGETMSPHGRRQGVLTTFHADPWRQFRRSRQTGLPDGFVSELESQRGRSRPCRQASADAARQADFRLARSGPGVSTRGHQTLSRALCDRDCLKRHVVRLACLP